MLQKKLALIIFVFIFMFSFSSAIHAESGMISLDQERQCEFLQKNVMGASSGADVAIHLQNDATSSANMYYLIQINGNNSEKIDGELKPGEVLEKSRFVPSGEMNEFHVFVMCKTKDKNCTGSWEIKEDQISCFFS